MSYKVYGIFFATIFLFVTSCFFSVSSVHANPYFYLTGNFGMNSSQAGNFQLHLNTDGSPVDNFQVVIEYDGNFFQPVVIDRKWSVCEKWIPARSIPPGEDFEKITPYYFNNKIIISCKPPSSGYNGNDGLVISFTLLPHSLGKTRLMLSSAYMEFLGASIRPGAMDSYETLIIDRQHPQPVAITTPSPFPSFIPLAAIPMSQNAFTPTEPNNHLKVDRKLNPLIFYVILILIILLINCIGWLLGRKLDSKQHI